MDLRDALAAAAVVAAAYGLGCLVSGWYLVRWRTGGDLRTTGSGRAGGRNVRRVLGTGWAAVAGAGDILKGAVAVGLALVAAPVALPTAMAAVVAGHVWPVQLGFRGGRGIAPAFGAALAADPLVAAVAVALLGLLVAATRRFSAAGLAAVVAVPPIAWLLGRPGPVVGGLAAAAVLIVLAHRGRFRSLLAERPGFPT